MDVAVVAGWVCAAVFLLVAPGYLWTRVLMPGLRGLELALVSLGLSVASVTLALVLGNYLLDVPIAPVTSVWAGGTIALAALTPRLSAWIAARLRATLP